MELHDLRKNYGKDAIPEEYLPADPFDWFGDWLRHALLVTVHEANAMVLSTVSGNGQPSSRIVLLKQFDENGFLFFTNYESRKGIQLSSNPAAALLFFWPELERQVRIEGIIIKADAAVSDEYFLSRPMESQVSAVVSPQSQVIPTHKYLVQMHREFSSSHSEGKFSRPENWGGYLLSPHLFEFWQGRSNRLHDRILFELINQEWKRCRLAP